MIGQASVMNPSHGVGPALPKLNGLRVGEDCFSKEEQCFSFLIRRVNGCCQTRTTDAYYSHLDTETEVKVLIVPTSEQT